MPLYDFLNGTTKQKDRWREGTAHLLNTPVDTIGLSITVEFVPPEELSAQTTLAETTWTYDSASATTKVRNDYPSFGGGDGKLESLEAEAHRMGLVYSAERHSLETPAHELGHAWFASLSESVRLKIVRMFGLDTDDPAVLAPPGTLWQNRVAEGIADTFKEAFLPARLRVFPNRTNRRISYSKFPEFRRLFRGASGGVPTGFYYLYGSDQFRVDLSTWKLTRLPYHKSAQDDEAFVFYEELSGYEKCWGIDMSQFSESSHMPFSIEPEGGISS
jgi:hypothetical protein